MKIVPDIIAPDLWILFIGFNPGLRSAETGRHFAGHSNRFWKLLYQSGLTPRLLQASEDTSLLSLGYGITNIVARPSRSASEILPEEYRQGRILLAEKLIKYQPAVACYAGIGVYKQFTGKPQASPGAQPVSEIEGILDYVVPSPSGLNRISFADQLKHYVNLRTILLDMPQKPYDIG